MTSDFIALREIAIGGVYLSPLLVYAGLGLFVTLLLRVLLHRLLGARRLWYQAWFDTALFVITTAAFAYAFSATAFSTVAGTS